MLDELHGSLEVQTHNVTSDFLARKTDMQPLTDPERRIGLGVRCWRLFPLVGAYYLRLHVSRQVS